MILTTITEIWRYRSIHPLFSDAFENLKKMYNEPFCEGKTEIDGETLYCNAFEYNTKGVTEAVFEAHRKYIDVMLLYSGQEKIGYLPLSRVERVISPYDEDADASLAELQKNMRFIDMISGDVVIFFPEDMHAPGIDLSGMNHVRKIVMKIAVEQ